jgi:ribosomal protein L37AE/L43A
MSAADGHTGPAAAPGAAGAAGEEVGGRAVPYACPFCGEEDLRPVEGGRWHCRTCLRVFAVQFFGLLRPTAPTDSRRTS